MSIKSILCLYGGAPFEQEALGTAVMLASHFQAEARVLQILTPPEVYPELYGLGLPGQPLVNETSLLETLVKTNADQRQTAEAAVMEAANALDIPYSRDDCFGPLTGKATAVFCPISARVRFCLPSIGRVADLIVVGRDRTGPFADLEAIQCGLFDTGRPVLLVPHTCPATSATLFPRRIAVAWDGSVVAARALHQSLDVLRGAEKVEVICVRSRGAEPETGDGGNLSHWLDLHGLPAHIRRLDKGDQTVGEHILTEAAAFGADWLVMGAYGHSHITEAVFGGVTNHVLKYGHLPVWLAH